MAYRQAKPHRGSPLSPPYPPMRSFPWALAEGSNDRAAAAAARARGCLLLRSIVKGKGGSKHTLELRRDGLRPGVLGYGECCELMEMEVSDKLEGRDGLLYRKIVQNRLACSFDQRAEFRLDGDHTRNMENSLSGPKHREEKISSHKHHGDFDERPHSALSKITRLVAASFGSPLSVRSSSHGLLFDGMVSFSIMSVLAETGTPLVPRSLTSHD